MAKYRVFGGHFAQGYPESLVSSNRVFTSISLAVAAAIVFFSYSDAHAYDRYNDGCQNCHGEFTGPVTVKGSVFPNNDKHRMHRSSANMDAECDLCHTDGDGRDAFIGSSNGTANNTGYGCVGCHGRLEDAGNDGISLGLGAGLRQHHNNAGITSCAICHTDANPINYAPVGEDIMPPYYGTVDTNADMSCNPGQTVNENENWTIGDFVGLDNDGDLMYDAVLDPDCMAVISIPGDMDGDGVSDILWRNSSNGQNALWRMVAGNLAENLAVPAVSDTTWKVVGRGDYNGDGMADILWRKVNPGQPDDGSMAVWLMQGVTLMDNLALPAVPGQDWQVVGNSDFTGDGHADILWRNMANGQNALWQINDGLLVANLAVPQVGDLDWAVASDGDFDGDKKSDILWRKPSTGENALWLMDGATRLTNEAVDAVADPNWLLMADGDYNDDGITDLFWRNTSTGVNAVWLMDGSLIADNLPTVNFANNNWQVAGDSGDYDGDGKSDLLWRESSTGENSIWIMDSADRTGHFGLPSVAVGDWEVVGTN